jgi:hydrogenase maturation protease
MTQRTPRPVRVLVCGEQLRGDDGAALRAVERLPADCRALADVVVVGQLSIEALLDVPEGVAVIVVDAATGIAPGVVVTVPLGEVARPGAAAPASTHSLPPDQVIAVAAGLRGELPRGSFVGIGAADFSFGETLSPAVESGLGAFIEAIATAIRELATP